MDQDQTIFTVWSSVHGYSGYQSKSPLIFTIPKESKHKESCPRHQMQGHLTLLLFDICFRCHSKESLHFPKEQKGSTFLEKTDTQLSHSSSFIKIFTRIIGSEKGPNYQSHLALATHESGQPTQVSVSFDYG